MSKVKKNKTIVEAVETVETTVETPVEEKVVYVGTIKDCEKLNVRETSSVDAKVLCKLDKKSEVIVEKAESTKDFYKVCLASGVCGYCMKKFMSVKKRGV